MTKNLDEDALKKLLGKLNARPVEFDSENPSVKLAYASYSKKEVIEALDSMTSTYVTMGEKVESFERKWSDYLDVDYGVMTNSGSSANLIALKSISKRFDSNSEVIVPAISWSTTVFPVIDAGAKPVFTDIDMEKLRMDMDSVESAINENTEAIVAVHLLGNPAPIERLKHICEKHNLALIEDCAQAHGASYKDKKVGSFGDISTFSFSFSHHITTMEGGMAVTNSKNQFQDMKMHRSWGRVRDLENNEKFDKNNKDVLFASHGYNVRPLEVQAAFGIHQVEKMRHIVKKRRDNAFYLDRRLNAIDQIKLIQERQDTECSYLHYPIIIEPSSSYERDELRDHLESKGIETRPFLSGNLAEHPAFTSENSRVEGKLEGANNIDKNGMYIGVHHRLTEQHLEHIVESVTSFFES